MGFDEPVGFSCAMIFVYLIVTFTLSFLNFVPNFFTLTLSFLVRVSIPDINTDFFGFAISITVFL
jgi:hypothetical protein